MAVRWSHLAQVDAANLDGALLRIEESGGEQQNRRLSRPGWSDNRRQSASRRDEVQISQDRGRAVAKADPPG